MREAAFLDKSVSPDGVQQLFLLDQTTCIADQEEKGFEQFRCKAHPLAIAQEGALGGVQLKRPKPKAGIPGSRHHSRATKSFRNASEFPKDANLELG